MVVLTKDGYAIHRQADKENIVDTARELLNIIGQLPAEYSTQNLYLVTWLIADMLPDGELLNRIR